MPRKSKSTENLSSNEEVDVIVKGLIRIKQGFLDQDWDKVAEGYSSITGEKLVRVVKKTKLELIREKFADNTESKSEKSKIIIPSSGDFQEDEEDEDVKHIDLPTGVPGEDEIVHNANLIKQKGGKMFGLGTINIITDGIIEAEASRNQKKPKIVRGSLKRRPNVLVAGADDPHTRLITDEKRIPRRGN